MYYEVSVFQMMSWLGNKLNVYICNCSFLTPSILLTLIPVHWQDVDICQNPDF